MKTSLTLEQVVWVDPERMGGTPCFTGTRVPIQALLDHLEEGDSLDIFIEGFPSVSREQAVAFLELAKDRLFLQPAVTQPLRDISKAKIQEWIARGDAEMKTYLATSKGRSK